MDYFGILKRAYEISLKHRYLWIFGILAGGFGTGFQMSLPSNANFSDKLDKFFSSPNTANLETFWLHYWGIIISIVALFFLLGLIWLVLSVISQGALLGSVTAIQKKENHNFRLGFLYGLNKFWRVLGVGLFIFLFVLLSIIVLALPVVLLIIAKIYVLAAIYGLLLFFGDLIFWIYLGVMSPYILRSVILGNLTVWEAITSSWDFFKQNWKEIVITYFLLMAVGIAAGTGILITGLLIGGLLFAIGLAIYLLSQFFMWLYIGIFGTLFVILILILGGIYNTFRSAVLTLVYLELIKKS